MKVKAKELTGASVSHISLVDRGANREPFRIIKAQGDTEMLDFTNGFKGLFQKREARAPTIVAVAFSKQYDPTAAAALLTGVGLPFGDAIASDEALTFPIDGATDMEGVVLFKLNDDIAVAVRHDDPETVKKGFEGYNFESTDFKEVLGTNTAMPMIGVSMSALQDTIYNIMSNSDTVEVAKTDIDKALGDFGGVVNEIISKVPATAFKLEAAASKVVTAKADDKDPKTDTTNKDADKKAPAKEPAPTGGVEITEELERKTSAEPTEQEKAGEEAVITTAGLDPETVKKAANGDVELAGKLLQTVATHVKATAAAAEPGAGAGAAAEEDPLKVTKTDDDPILVAMKKMLEPLTASVTELGENLKKQGDDLKSTQDAFKKFDKELGGSGVIGGEQADGDDEIVEIHKVDLEDGETANDDGFLVIDTAYSDPFTKEEKRAARR